MSNHISYYFGDDCLLERPIRSQGYQTAVQEDLDALAEWCTKWGMRFDAKKYEYMRRRWN